MKKFFVVLITLFTLVSCSNDDSGGNTPNNDVQNTDNQDNNDQDVSDVSTLIADNVVSIEKDNSELISDDAELDVGIYKIQFDQSPPVINVDDIIFGDEGDGFLRRVSSITVEGNLVSMETSQASMEELFVNANIDFETLLSESFDDSSGKNSSTQKNLDFFASGVSYSNAEKGLRFSFNNVQLFDLSNIDFKIRSGSVTYNSKQNLKLEYNDSNLLVFEYSEDSNLDVDVTFSSTINSGVSVPLRTIRLFEGSRPTVIPVGSLAIPAIIYFRLSAKSILSVSESNSLSKRFESSNSFQLGARYAFSSNAFVPIVARNSSFNAHPTSIETQYVSLNESIEFVPEITVALFGLAGPSSEIPVSSNLGINVATSEDWDAYYGSKIDLKFGIRTPIFSFNIPALPLTSFDVLERELWNAPDKIEKIESTDNQTAGEQQTLGEPIRVRIVDSSGLVYLKGVPVYFSVVKGGGTLSSEKVTTDDNGYAEVSWTLGDPGEQEVDVIVRKADGTSISETPVKFSATSEGIDLQLEGDLNFGEIPIDESEVRTLTITNPHSVDTEVNSITLPLGYTADWTSGTIQAQSNQNVVIRFEPTIEGSYPGEIVVNSDIDPNGVSIAVNGTGVAGSLDLSGTWILRHSLGSGLCDETLINDERNLPLNLSFNENGSITFLNDPGQIGLNGAGFTQTYSFNSETNELTINIQFLDTGGGVITFVASLIYNSSTNSFSGSYTNNWGDGDVCVNTLIISK